MKEKNWKILGYCFLLSILFLLIGTKSSPLYQFNDWVDANIFFTVGKSMVRGVVPYVELFEQKGPLLYLIYGIGSLISYKTFFGVFLLEVAFFTIFLYYTYRCFQLYLKKETCCWLLPLFVAAIIPLRCFTHGGSAEEFCFPFLMISLFHLLKFLKEEELKISKKVIFINGIIAGGILWIKYTLLGFWFAWMLCIFLLLFSNKRIKEAIQDGFIFLGGMVLASIPWILYFGLHHGIQDLIEVYFTFNIKYYSSEVSLFEKLGKTLHLLQFNFRYYLQFTFFILIPIVISFFTPILFPKKGRSFVLLLSVFLLGIGIYIGGTNYRYYALILAPFMMLGFLLIGILIEHYFSYSKTSVLWAIVNCFCIIAGLFYTYQQSPNTAMLTWKKEEYAQFVFADIISQNADPTLLNYGFLDGGFYTTTGTIPKHYFFMRNNISYKVFPKLMKEQRRYVKEKQPHYVIVRTPTSISYEVVKENYHEIKRHQQIFQGNPIEYILFERNKTKGL